MPRLLLLYTLPLIALLAACDKKDVVPTPMPQVQGSPGSEAKAAAPAPTGPKEKADYIAAAEKDLAEIKARIVELKASLQNLAGDAKAIAQKQLESLEADLLAAEARLGELKSASIEKWKELRQGTSAAIERLKESVQKVRNK